MSGSQASVRGVSSLFIVWRAQLLPVFSFANFASRTVSTQHQKLPLNTKDSSNWWKMMMTSYFCDYSLDLRRAASSLSCAYLLVVRMFLIPRLILTRMKKEVVGDGRERSNSLPTLPTLLDFFSIFTRMNFVVGRTNQDYVNAQHLEASMKIEVSVQLLMLCLSMSSNVPQSTISVKPVSTG